MNWVARQAAAAAPQSLPNPVEAAVRDNFVASGWPWMTTSDRPSVRQPTTPRRLVEHCATGLLTSAKSCGRRSSAPPPIAHRSLDEARWQRLMAERALSAYQQISLWSFLASAM